MRQHQNQQLFTTVSILNPPTGRNWALNLTVAISPQHLILLGGLEVSQSDESKLKIAQNSLP